MLQLLRQPVLNCRKADVMTVVCAANPAAQTSRRLSYGQQNTLPIAVFVSQFLLIATNLPNPEGWTIWLTVPAPGIEPGPI